MIMSAGNSQTAWTDNFTGDSSLNTGIFPIHWGDSSELSFGNSGVTLRSDGNAVGFMTQDQGASTANSYGLYSVTFAMPANQASGAYICLWPASNVWPGPEIDLVEESNGQGYLTVHWQGSNNSNGYHAFDFSANLSQPTTISVDWEANSLTFDVNGRQAVQYLSGGAVPIPKDYADGGENESFGVGNVGPAGTSVTVSSMSYSPVSAISAPAPTSPVPSTTINISAPGTLQEASAGAGATAAVTISDPGLSEVHAVVMTSKNVAEGSWIDVPLNASGQATATFNFEHTGDYVVAVNDTTTPTDFGYSFPVTITDPVVVPSTTIAVSNPGIQFVSNSQNGADAPITFSDPGLKEVYAFVMNSHNAAEENWIGVPLNSQGQATYNFHFQHSGDYVVAVNDPAMQADKGVSAQVAIYPGT